MSLLTRRTVVLAGIEATYNVVPTLNAATDAILVEEPEFTADPQVLERNFTSFDLSQKAHVIGRKLAGVRFTTELRGNGKVHSGALADAPILGRLFRACGFSETAVQAAQASDVFEVGDHSGRRIGWATAGTLSTTTETAYHIEVTTGGGSGVAQVSITSDDPTETAQTGVTLTDTMAVTVGTKGLTITPTFGSSTLVEGQSWQAHLTPTGIVYEPVSTGFESITLDVFMDGVKHRVSGAMGTFSVQATAGEYAKVSWEFTGNYTAPVDEAMPSATYETTLPAMVELARLRTDGYAPIVNAMSYDQANTITVLPDVNASNGYRGVRITARTPTGGIDPEATLVADQDFWGKMATAKVMPFQMRIGQARGNTVWIKGPATQYTGLTYRDRDGIRTFDAGLKFVRYAGDDEVRFVFT